MERYININEYLYDLPTDRIAVHPLQNRTDSKLLVYRKGDIQHEGFSSLPKFIGANTTLFFNNTKVIPARLHFSKDTGAIIEIFLLAPVAPATNMLQAMQAKHMCTWKCTIGNLKKWNPGLILKQHHADLTVDVELINREENLVTFRWNTDASFAEVVSSLGETPLPPYLKRNAEEEDKIRYQTVYAEQEGAVAAPTAGLHFTPEILSQLKSQGVIEDFVTLHVSAGTFQPVKVENAVEHPMHNEQIIITRENIETLLLPRQVIAVGTTSLRTLESTYWYGVKLLQDKAAEFRIEQNDPYTFNGILPSAHEAFQAILSKMEAEQVTSLMGNTSIFIMPGYSFRVVEGLITNFHQPGSTLMLLVAAFIGEHWKRVYNDALSMNYRVLSYGDSSLLLP
jgi:S-adenosylmethionine:tRNA ribosyltransferase-isomerase